MKLGGNMETLKVFLIYLYYHDRWGKILCWGHCFILAELVYKICRAKMRRCLRHLPDQSLYCPFLLLGCSVGSWLIKHYTSFGFVQISFCQSLSWVNNSLPSHDPVLLCYPS
jgi:hypothetical protein